MGNLNQQFNRELKILMIPTIIQMIIGNSFSFINTMMVSGLGDTAIAVTAAAGQISFMLGMILSAIYGVNVFITQFYGKQDMVNVRKSFAIMLISSFVVSIAVSVLVLMFKYLILSIFIHDEQAIAIGGAYLTVIVMVYVINGVKDAYGNALGAVGQIKLNLYIGILAMLVNVILDYTLIYGKWGFPQLGIQGAAIATLIASSLSAILLCGYIYYRSFLFDLRLREIFTIDLQFTWRIYKTTLPLVLHEGAWAIGNMLYAVAFGQLGIAALAAYQLARTFKSYYMMGIYGFAYAAKVMIGRKLSEEDPREAIEYAQKFTRLALYSALTVSLLIILCTPLIVGLFTQLSAEVQDYFRNIMYIQSIVLVMYFLNNVWIVGMFRAGGDNVYTTKLIIVSTWFISLPLVFAGVYMFHWPVEIIYLCFALEEVSKAIIGYFRYRSNKWANNLVKNM